VSLPEKIKTGKETVMIADIAVATGGMLAQAEGILVVFVVVMIALAVFMIAAMWALFVKAGQPGWAVLIPIYYQYILCKMIDKSGWWVVLMIIPYVGIIFTLIFMVMWCGQVSKNFGRGGGTAVGLFFLPYIFVPILGFGSAQWGGRTPSTPPPAPAADPPQQY